MFNKANILVTGGTGSFGKKFVKRILDNYDVNKIIIYSRDEYKQFIMKNELDSSHPDKISKVRFFIGDVRDKERLYRAFKDIDYVIDRKSVV